MIKKPCGPGLMDKATEKRGHGSGVAVSRKEAKYEGTFLNSHELLPLAIPTRGGYPPDLDGIAEELGRPDARQGQEDAGGEEEESSLWARGVEASTRALDASPTGALLPCSAPCTKAEDRALDAKTAVAKRGGRHGGRGEGSCVGRGRGKTEMLVLEGTGEGDTGPPTSRVRG